MNTWLCRSPSTSNVAHLSLGDWYLEPTIIIGLALICALYIQAWRLGILSSTDNVIPWFRHGDRRKLVFSLGMILAVIALLSPLDRGGDLYLFCLHMLQHIILMMAVPPLVIFGIAGMDTSRWNGTGYWTRVAGTLTKPWLAVIIFNGVMLIWHAPALFNAALENEWIHAIQHLSFLGTGFLFWWPIVDPLRQHRRRPTSPVAKISMLALSGIPPTILGLLFTVSAQIFYPYYALAPRLWGIGLLVDQQIGGVLMLGLGNLIYFAAVAPIFWRLFGDPGADEAAAAARMQAAREGV